MCLAAYAAVALSDLPVGAGFRLVLCPCARRNCTSFGTFALIIVYKVPIMTRRLVIVALASSLVLPALAFAASKEDKQAEVRKAGKKALSALYQAQPSARKAVESAAGYAAFSNFGMKILLAGSGTGEGIAVNNKTKATTYMKMAELQAGLGMGVKKFQQVWVFENESALNKFITSGWQFGGQATAAAKAGDTGGAYQGAIAVAPGVWLYQLTDKGLAVEFTAKGTKYYVDNDLN